MGANSNWTVNEAVRKSTNVCRDKIPTRKFRIVTWITGAVIVILVSGDKIRPRARCCSVCRWQCDREFGKVLFRTRDEKFITQFPKAGDKSSKLGSKSGFLQQSVSSHAVFMSALYNKSDFVKIRSFSVRWQILKGPLLSRKLKQSILVFNEKNRKIYLRAPGVRAVNLREALRAPKFYCLSLWCVSES